MSDDPRDGEGEGGGGPQGEAGTRPELKLRSEQLPAIIWRIFSEDFHGTARPIDIANALLESEILDPEQIHGFARRALTEIVRTVLREHDALGIPKAGPVAGDEGEATRWQQRNLWGFEDYTHNIKLRRRAVKADYRVLYLMHAECLRRFGEAPEIPELIGGGNGEDNEEE